VSDALLRAVERRAWPGNVRELRNVAERMVALRKSDALDVRDLPPEDAPGTAVNARWNLGPGSIELPPEGAGLEEIERAVIEYALEKNAGNISAAARFLKVPRHILVYRIEKFGSRGEEYSAAIVQDGLHAAASSDADQPPGFAAAASG